jgi:hypothetical protein
LDATTKIQKYQHPDQRKPEYADGKSPPGISEMARL